MKRVEDNDQVNIQTGHCCGGNSCERPNRAASILSDERQQAAVSAGAPDVQSIQDFAKLWQSVEQIKVQSEVRRIEIAIADLASMKKQRSDEYQRLAIQLRAVLEE